MDLSAYRSPEMADLHITLWNTKLFYKRAGTSAPLGKNLAEYLQKHPEWEVYREQDKNLPPYFEFPRVTLWDKCNMRKIAGAAAPISCNLDKYLSDHNGTIEVYNGQDNCVTRNPATERVTMWNPRRGRKVAGRAAPQRKDLEKYLNARPHMQVYANQNKVTTAGFQGAHRVPSSSRSVQAEVLVSVSPETICDPGSQSNQQYASSPTQFCSKDKMPSRKRSGAPGQEEDMEIGREEKRRKIIGKEGGTEIELSEEEPIDREIQACSNSWSHPMVDAELLQFFRIIDQNVVGMGDEQAELDKISPQYGCPEHVPEKSMAASQILTEAEVQDNPEPSKMFHLPEKIHETSDSQKIVPAIKAHVPQYFSSPTPQTFLLYPGNFIPDLDLLEELLSPIV